MCLAKMLNHDVFEILYLIFTARDVRFDLAEVA